MNPPKFMTKEEFLEAAEHENLKKDYIEHFLYFAEEVERVGDGPFNFADAMPFTGIEVYSLQSSKPI